MQSSMQPSEQTSGPMAGAASNEAQTQGCGRQASSVWSELDVLLKLAGPTIVQTASQQAMVFTDQIFLGHLGTEAMAAAALGNMILYPDVSLSLAEWVCSVLFSMMQYANTLFFFLFGTATALDTLGAQAYGVQKQGVRTSVHLRTWCVVAALVLSILCIPITLGLAVGKQIATALQQPSEIAQLTSQFCKGLIPGALPLMWGLVLMKYLQVQNVVLGPALITAATLVLNIGTNFLFIRFLGFQGAPLATSFARLVQFLALCCLVMWFNRTRHSTRPLSPLARLLLQGADIEGASVQAQPQCVTGKHHNPSDSQQSVTDDFRDSMLTQQQSGSKKHHNAVGSQQIRPGDCGNGECRDSKAWERGSKGAPDQHLLGVPTGLGSSPCLHGAEEQDSDARMRNVQAVRHGSLSAGSLHGHYDNAAGEVHQSSHNSRPQHGTMQYIELTESGSGDAVLHGHVQGTGDASHLHSLNSKEQPLLITQCGLPDAQAHLTLLPSIGHPQYQGDLTSTGLGYFQYQADATSASSTRRTQYQANQCWQEPFTQPSYLSVSKLVHSTWHEVKAAVRPSLLWEYLKLGLPGGFMMSLEQISFDVTIALAAQLGPATVSAHTAMLNIIGLTFVSCPLAMGIAGSIRVGNLLGAGQPLLARLSAWLCVAIGGIFMLCAALVILISRHVVGYIFTEDKEVVAIMASIAPLAALFQVSDGLMGTSQGALRGCGKQRLLMLFNFVGFWPCGWLFGYFLCFHSGLGLKGLWLGIASGVTTTGIMNLITLARARWAHESQLATAKQTQQEQEQQQDDEAQPMLAGHHDHC